MIVFPMTREDSYSFLGPKSQGQTLKNWIRQRGGICPFNTGLVALCIIWILFALTFLFDLCIAILLQNTKKFNT